MKGRPSRSRSRAGQGRRRAKAAACPGSPPTSLPRAEELTRLPVVALVGRPNTGKSTLFNRLTRSRRALVASTPGVTRDRNIAPAECGGRRFLVVDTGGFEADEQEELARAVRGQAMVAAEGADAVIVVVDGRAGLNPLDAALVTRLRAVRRPLFLAVNKIDTPRQEPLEGEFHALGVERVHSISAEHGVNVGDLLDDVLACLPEAESKAPGDAATTAVAIVGRPNVGKSSLLNRLVGFDRAIVTPIPGTTRDAIDTPVERGGRSYLLVDTAGVRRRPKVHEHIERVSVVRALGALERAEVGLLVVDATEGMTEQDARIGGYAWERGRALVLVVNKWDAAPVERRDPKRFADEVDASFPSYAVVPKVFVSALTGRGVARIWAWVDAVAKCHRAVLPTGRLNQTVERATEAQAPPSVQGKRPRIFYAVQTATAPPTVTMFCSQPERFTTAYERYLANRIREAFALEGTPLRLAFRARRPSRAEARKRK